MKSATLEHLAPNLAKLYQQLAPLAPRVNIGRAFALTFGKRAFVALRYSDTRETPTGTRAYEAGERTYTLEALYVLGELPSTYVRNPGSSHSNGLRYVFNVSDDADAAGALAGRWYVGAYSSERSRAISAERGEYSGPMFLLFREDSEPIGHVRTRTETGRTL